MAQRTQQVTPTETDGVQVVDDVVEEIDPEFDITPEPLQPETKQPYVNGEMATTASFFGESQVEDRGIQVVELEPNADYIVRVTEDVGPIFLGRRRKLALEKGKAYKVDPDIYEYLSSRGLIYGE
jgi:hypothetical protein